jgi:hypothetical protein
MFVIDKNSDLISNLDDGATWDEKNNGDKVV